MQVQSSAVHVPGRGLHCADPVPPLVRSKERLLGQVVGLGSVAGEQVKRLEEPLVLGEKLLEHRGLADLGHGAQVCRLDYHAP